MNKGIIFFFVAVLVLSGVQAISYPSTHLAVTLLSQDPDPVEPGQIVTVKFKIENNGTQSDYDTIVKLQPKYPFSMYGDSAEKNIGKLRAGSSGADAAIVEFKLKIDEQAVQQDTSLDLVVQSGNTGVSYTNKEFLISIKTQNAILNIGSVSYEPSPISPGGTSKVTIMLKNNAGLALKNIKFKLDMSSSTLPLAPYQSSSEMFVSQLQPNYQQSLMFTLIAKPDADAGLYKIPINLTYADINGVTTSSSDVLAVMIGEKPHVGAYIKKSTVLEAGNAGKITLEAANAGTTNVKYAELTLLPSDDYKLVSTHNYFYLGNIDSDDTQSEEIDIYINKKVDKVRVPVRLQYVDATGAKYQQAFDLEMNVYSSSELKKFGVIQSNNLWIYVIIVLLIAGGFLAYQYYYKKRKNEKNKK